jgi:hypothetical protein
MQDFNLAHVHEIAKAVINFGVRSNSGRIRKLAKENKAMLSAVIIMTMQLNYGRGQELLNFVQKEIHVEKQAA